MDVASKTVAHFVPKSHMGGFFACHDHARLTLDMPNRTRHRWGDVACGKLARFPSKDVT